MSFTFPTYSTKEKMLYLYTQLAELFSIQANKDAANDFIQTYRNSNATFVFESMHDTATCVNVLLNKVVFFSKSLEMEQRIEAEKECLEKFFK